MMKRCLRGWAIFLLIALAGMAEAEILDGVAAVVNEDIITRAELDRQYSMLLHQLQAQQQPLPPEEKLKSQVLQHMIDVELQVQEARTHGIQIEDTAVDQAIKSVAQQNKISQEELVKQVKQEGYSYEQYKKNIKEQMVIREVQSRLVGSKIQIKPEMLDREFKLALKEKKDASEYHIKNILIALSDAPTSKEYAVAKQKANEFYKRIKLGGSFDSLAMAESSDASALEAGDLGWRTVSAMPQVFVQAIQKLKVGEVTQPIETPNGFHLVKLVAKRSAIKPHTTKLTHVRHVLIQLEGAGNEKSALKRMRHMRQAIAKGEKSFETIATNFSDDVASAKNGGDLGWVKKGDLVPAFEAAMLKLKPGEVSEPIRTQFGLHLIQVLGRKEVDDTLDQYKLQVANQLYQREFESHVKDWLQTLRSKSYIVAST